MSLALLDYTNRQKLEETVKKMQKRNANADKENMEITFWQICILCYRNSSSYEIMCGGIKKHKKLRL